MSDHLINNDKHFAYTSSSDVKSICMPLFKTTKINYFHYGRLYPDGSYMALSTNASWLKWALTVVHEWPEDKTLQEGLYFWKNNCPAIEHNASNNFHMYNGLTIIQKTEANFWEIIDFTAADTSYKTIEFYFNNLSLLKEFILYFKVQAKQIINSASLKSNILQLRSSDEIIKAEKNLLSDNAISQKNFLHELKLLPIESKFGTKYLTRREIDCLTYLIRGKSAKEIAKSLGNISYRTVEDHIMKIRSKLRCFAKSGLYELIRQNNLVESLLDDFV